MHMRPFEIALIGIFSIAALIGMVILSGYTPGQSKEDRLYGDKVEIWGTFSKKIMDEYLLELGRDHKALQVVKYTEMDPRSFERQFLDAIAEGNAPDLVILPHPLLITYQTKLQPISYETIPERDFRDAYIDGAEIYMLSDGVYGIPLAADPLVMYWNRDLFATAGVAQPPRTWETLVSQTTKALTRTNDQLEITQSAVAFGEYTNVSHAKDILSMLFLQAGSDVVDEQNGEFRITLNDKKTQGLPVGETVLDFYTQFSTPSSPLYAWNRSMSSDRVEFVGGDLALYFGKGTERKAIERENANLNYDVAPVPQASGSTIKRNYADFYAFVIPRGSRNQAGAYGAALYLSDPSRVTTILDQFDLAPVHRALYTGAVADPFKSNVYESALVARGWLDPSPRETSDIFRTMVEEVAFGHDRISAAVQDAVYELEKLFY